MSTSQSKGTRRRTSHSQHSIRSSTSTASTASVASLPPWSSLSRKTAPSIELVVENSSPPNVNDTEGQTHESSSKVLRKKRGRSEQGVRERLLSLHVSPPASPSPLTPPTPEGKGKQRQKLERSPLSSTKSSDGLFTMYADTNSDEESKEAGIGNGNGFAENGEGSSSSSVKAAPASNGTADPEPDATVIKEESTNPTGPVVTAPEPALESPAPANTSSTSPPTKPRSSWFTSLSRSSTPPAKGKSRAPMPFPSSSSTNNNVSGGPEPEPEPLPAPVTSPSQDSISSLASEATVTLAVQPPSTPDLSSADAAPKSPPQPIPHLVPTHADTLPPTSASASTSPTPSRRRTWFGTASSSSPPPNTNATPLSPRTPLSPMYSSSSIPSSIDEEVPTPPSATIYVHDDEGGRGVVKAAFPSSHSPPSHSRSPSQSNDDGAGGGDGDDARSLRSVKSSDTLHGHGHGGEGRERKLSSLNPSTSRFTLSIPLLGRAKAPLPGRASNEQLAAKGKAAGDNKVESDVKDEVARVPEVKVDEADPDPQGTIKASKENHPAGPVGSASWWDYVGWTSSGPPSVKEPASTANEDVGTSPPEPPQAAPVPSPPASAPATVPSTPGPSSLKPDQEAAAKKALSVKSASESAWYTPWSWYYQQAQEAQSNAGNGERSKNGGEEGEMEDVKGREMTEAEMVREEALARDNVKDKTVATTSSSADDKSKSTSQMAPSAQWEGLASDNPIASTMAGSNASSSSMRAGWASFFSSRAALGKGVGDGRAITDGSETGVGLGAGEMEVMDVPDADEQQEVEKDKEKDETPPSPTRSTMSQSLKERAKEKLKAKAKQKAPPLMISDEVKRESEVLKASSSSNTSRKNSVSGLPVPSVAEAKSKPATRNPSPSPSTSGNSSKSAPPALPPKVPKANVVLPRWEDTFEVPPRTTGVPQKEKGRLERLGGFVKGVLFNAAGGEDNIRMGMGKRRATEGMRGGRSLALRGDGDAGSKAGEGGGGRFELFGMGLPRAWDVVEGTFGESSSPGVKGKAKEVAREAGIPGAGSDVLKGAKRVVVIGVHGWFPGAMMRSVLGEPTGTSAKFVSMTVQALADFEEKHGVKLDKVTQVPLEGEGTIEKRVEKLYTNLTENEEWMRDLREADVIFVATHSQGSVVSTHLLDRLIRDGHVVTDKSTSALPYSNKSTTSVGVGVDSMAAESAFSAPGALQEGNKATRARKPQRICCLALCGIHLGPLRYLSTSSVLQPYIQYFESKAASELFEFQNTESRVSQEYVAALKNVVDHGTKMVYIASLNDQVVPIYSGIFTSVSHPLILRALYIDGDAYHSSDFLSNLLVLLLRIMNAGIPDSGLLAHLSEATAGSLNGVGHSTAYEEIATFRLAVDYLFLTNEGLQEHPPLTVEPFNADTEQNDYEIPWSLRDLIADERVAHFFSREILELRDAFRDWHPKTTILRDLKRKLQPIQRLPPSFMSEAAAVNAGSSKL